MEAKTIDVVVFEDAGEYRIDDIVEIVIGYNNRYTIIGRIYNIETKHINIDYSEKYQTKCRKIEYGEIRAIKKIEEGE
jgi:hypothetical protein